LLSEYDKTIGISSNPEETLSEEIMPEEAINREILAERASPLVKQIRKYYFSTEESPLKIKKQATAWINNQFFMIKAHKLWLKNQDEVPEEADLEAVKDFVEDTQELAAVTGWHEDEAFVAYPSGFSP